MDTLQLIQHAADNNPSKFQDTFNQLIAPKVMDAIAAKKIEIAQNYFATSQQDTEAGEWKH